MLQFDDLPHTPAQHFRLALYATIARLIEQCTGGDLESAFGAQPFLAEYHDALLAHPGAEPPVASAWREALARWERATTCRLPMKSLEAIGISPLGLELLLVCGLVEEDPRFGDLFAQVRGGTRRPTLALWIAWWRDGDDGSDRGEAVRRAAEDLIDRGLLDCSASDAPRLDWPLAVPRPLWQLLRGDPLRAKGLEHRPRACLPLLEGLVWPEPLRSRARTLLGHLRSAPAPTLVLEGPPHNGRGTLAEALAGAAGKGLLWVDASAPAPPSAALIEALALLLDAWPALRAETTLPRLQALPLIAVARKAGAIELPAAAISCALPMPLRDERLRHWQQELPDQHSSPALADFAEAARLPRGRLRLLARAAAARSAAEGRHAVEGDDLRAARRSLPSGVLETLATRLPPPRGSLALDAATRDELDALAARCRHREVLAEDDAGPCGVRALFTGASGTGKTMAARELARALDRDCWRVDLAATVDKYVGETEKRLDQIFGAAETLDIVLLLDEGDALMAPRTDVHSATDRFANLETNFLLQRIESFDGFVIVTSNAGERIDRAFARRMDASIAFRLPDEALRYQILRMHLGDAAPPVDDWLQQLACRCELSGAQLRSIVGHARLLALQQRTPIGAPQLHAALTREYRRRGAICPLRAVA